MQLETQALGGKNCTPFLMRLFEFLETNFLSSLDILDISPLSELGLVKILSQSVGGLFILLTVSYYSAIKNNEFMKFLDKWMYLEEAIQLQKSH